MNSYIFNFNFFPQVGLLQSNLNKDINSLLNIQELIHLPNNNQDIHQRHTKVPNKILRILQQEHQAHMEVNHLQHQTLQCREKDYSQEGEEDLWERQ